MALAAGQDTRDDLTGFTSGGRRIRVEWFEGRGEGRLPGILMLHGADGTGPHYRTGARQIAEAGYHVALVHYLDRTGERRVNYGTLMQNALAWLATVADALDWAATRPGVDPDRLGILGVSLGGLLGIATANQDQRVKALATYFAPLPQAVAGHASRLPPTLVLHGEQDRLVPVANAHALAGILARQGVEHEVKIYPGQGHGFHGEVQADADRRIRAFFARHLGA